MTAAAARKLQKEIDNVLKKVDDGIGEFAEYWEQASAAASNQQKERLGEELKRSINKLQRLRAQIRDWIAQSGVQSTSKDKLEDARRRIENDMQRFKEFERELKTKAFSTCALARADELELEEAEKIRYQEWLTQTIQDLNHQLDQFEADLELLGNKKSLSGDEKSRIAQLKILQERHRWHIMKLELILRAVDNDAIDMTDLAIVRESVELYVEGHQDPDCYHDESLYDCFDLTEFEDKAPKPRSQNEGVKESSPPPSSKEEPQRKTKEKEKRRKEEKKDKKKEDRDKKITVASPIGTIGVTNGTKVKNDTKLAPPTCGDIIEPKVELREKLDVEEVKVQEDQLLSEAEEFICKICQIHVVGCSPKLTSCSHLFCGDCIAQWFAQHPESQTWAQRARSAGPERVVPCPVCKQPLNEKRDLYPVCSVTSRSENLLLWRMLSSLKIMCANHPKVQPDGKCDWIGEYGSYQKHIWSCKNAPATDTSTCNSTEAPGHRASVDSESEGGSVTSKDMSRKSTPAMVASPPATRSSPVPSPFLAPQPAPPAALSPVRNTSSSSPSNAAANTTPLGGATASSPSSIRATGTAPVASAAQAVAPAAGDASLPSRAMGDVPTAPGAISSTTVASASISTPANRTTTTPPPATSTTTATPQKVPHVEPAASPSRGTGTVTGSSSPSQEPKASASTAPGSRPFLVPESQVQQQQQQQQQNAVAQEGDGSVVMRATSSFEPTGSNMIQVHVGDLIQVQEQHSSGWTYAKNLHLPASTNAGWVPSWIVQPVHGTDMAVQSKQKAPEGHPQESSRSPAPAISVHTPKQPLTGGVQAPAAQQAQVTGASPVNQNVEARTIIRATAAFNGVSPSQLTLAQADLVEIVERHASGWTYGRKVCETSSSSLAEGWFPDWVCPHR